MNQRITKLACVLVVLAVAGVPAWAQPLMRFPQSTNTVFQPSTGAGVYTPTAPSTTFPSAPSTAPATLGPPRFDPYSSALGAANTAPSLSGPPSGFGATPPGTVQTPFGATPNTISPTYPGPPAVTSGAAPGTAVPGAATPYGAANPYGQPTGAYPPGAFPSGAPPSLWPSGFNSAWTGPAVRFLTPRVRYTWINDGNSWDDVGINDFDFSLAAAFPNFLYSNQPLYVVPSFSLHLWSGPRFADQDLPANAYSAFLDFGWTTDPTKPIGGEIGLRLGVFTDFNTFNSKSGRIMGQGLFRVQATPTLALRGGVIYIDRNDLKLLPAFGLLWTPNPETRFDIFFPKPKLAQRMTTMGSHDLWWYLAAEYGGGAWTIERTDTSSDRIDINDIRVILGLEWGQPALLAQGQRTGFFEVGWVTQRELVYVVTPSDTTSLRDSFMLRVGFNY